MVRSATGKGEAPVQPANDASISPAVEQSLADAIDPVRWLVRVVRKSSGPADVA